MYDIIDALCVASGVYLVYTAIVMKVQGKIISNVVLNKGRDESAIRDKEGFIRFLYGKLILVGILVMLAGAANMINFHMIGSGIITLISTILFAAAIAGYGVAVNKALRKYVD